MHNRNRAVGRLRWIAVVIMLVVMFLVRYYERGQSKSPAKKKRVMSCAQRVTFISVYALF